VPVLLSNRLYLLVAHQNKIVGRQNAINFIQSYGSLRNKGIAVRVNCPISTDWGLEEIETFLDQEIDAIIIPKVESEAVIELATEVMSRKSKIKPIWAMIETPKGVMNVDKIAMLESLEALVFGSNDLTNELNARHTREREPLLYSMSRVILAGRAYGKYVIDGVHMNLKDNDGFRESCIQGKSLGFDGKSLIHPDQVEDANKYFSPSTEEVEYAKKVLKAIEDAQLDENSLGVCVVDGKLVENLHVRQARRIHDIHEYLSSR
jgi:citrate lyase subunit beta/citryl-CoA lyase